MAWCMFGTKPLPEPTTGTVKLAIARTFADKNWVGQVKLLCITMFKISENRQKSLFGVGKVQKFFAVSATMIYCWYHPRKKLGEIQTKIQRFIFSRKCIDLEMLFIKCRLFCFGLNSLRAKFFGGNINIHLHFMSLLHIDMTQVLKILPQARPGPTYST